MLRRLRNYFFSGLLVVVPIGVTIWIVWGIFSLFDSWYSHLAIKYGFHDFLKQHLSNDFNAPEFGIGFLLTVTSIIFIGFLTQLYLGKKVLGLVDNVFLQIPGVSNLYHGLKQVTETLMGRRKGIFERVVLIEYPRVGLYSLAFITGRDEGLLEPLIEKGLVYLFIATTPNPTSGIFLIVPETEVTPVDISVEDAMKMIISSGMVSPRRNQEELLDAIPSPRDED
jgi:uncharacterized membrane protein